MASPALTFHMDQGRRLVHQVNGLIGEKPPGEEADREIHRRAEGFIRNREAMVGLVASAQPL